MSRRAQAYKNEMMRRFEVTGKPGTVNAGIGAFIFGERGEMRFGCYPFQYWDEDAFVNQELQYLDGHEIEIMERLSVSGNRSLSCSIEVSSGGKTVRHSDEFPLKIM